MSKQGIINIVFAIGLVVLSVLHFSSSEQNVMVESSDQEEMTPRRERDSSESLKVGYIRTDSLLTKYERHKDLQDMLQGKISKMEREWERKTRLFQENLKVMEEEAPKMSQRELAMAQQELEMKQQELLAFRERKTQEFMREEQELNKQVYEEVYEAINKVQEKLGLDMVFMLEMGGSLVWAHDSFNITNEMVDELNRMHNAKKEKK